MINIYLASSDKYEFNKFLIDKDNLEEFKKRKINFNSNFSKSEIVFYMFNFGAKKLFKLNKLWLSQQYDHTREYKNIEYFISRKKKIIIYYRSDGSSINSTINDLLKKYPESILFVMRDFLLNENKIYKLLLNSHMKYLINQIFPKKGKENIKNTRIYQEFKNNLKKQVCLRIPKCLTYSFENIPFSKKNNKKIYDIFYVKNIRENTYNGIYRKKIYEKLDDINRNNKYNIYSNQCNKNTFYKKLLQSKIMISVWGIGESLIDDYYCIANDVIVLKVDSSHVDDFYNLFKKDNIFYFFNIDLSNLEERIDYILKNYDYCYKKYNIQREKIKNKFTNQYYVNEISKNICKYYE